MRTYPTLLPQHINTLPPPKEYSRGLPVPTLLLSTGQSRKKRVPGRKCMEWQLAVASCTPAWLL